MIKKALVVDNDFFFVEFLTELLESRQIHVLKAYDGKEGVSTLEQESVDLLFVDMIMPKIDGKQLIDFTRDRFPSGQFPIIALSGAIVESMEKLGDIGADYFIAKGPMEKMARNIESLLDKIEENQKPVSEEDAIIIPHDLIPRQITDELVKTVKFNRAIQESLSMGMLVLDRDARIILFNKVVLKILKKHSDEVLNQQVISIFPEEDQTKIIEALKKLLFHPEMKKATLSVDVHDEPVLLTVSLLRIDGDVAGWVIVLEDSVWAGQA